MPILQQIAISVIASILTFIVTTVVYQRKKEAKDAKIQTFKTLMSARGVSDYNAVLAFNAIDIVFANSRKVCEAWDNYHKSLAIGTDTTPTDAQRTQMQNCEIKLFEAMAKDLGYKNIDWEKIKNPYCPKWLNDRHKGIAAHDNLAETLTLWFAPTKSDSSESKPN